MIRQVDSLEFGPLPSPPPFRAPSFLVPPVEPVPTAPETAPVEKAEQEITRLTWAVLDGSASLTDRQRLAELVDAQHALRRR